MTDVLVLDTRCFDDKALYTDVYGKLSERRRNKVDSYRLDSDKRLSLGAGYLFEYGLRSSGMSALYAHVDYGKNGKPFIKGAPYIHFNLAHSGVYAVCAFSQDEVGVDIEKVGETRENIIRLACCKSECKRLMALRDEAQRSELFYRIWTIKESFMKYLGTGLSIPPEVIETDTDKRACVKVDGHKQDVYFKEYPLAGYKLTVCTGDDSFAPAIREIKPNKCELKPKNNKQQ